MADLSQQLIERVSRASEEKNPLCIVGRGSKTFLGRHPVGELVSVARHAGIVDYQPLECVITVRAGTSLAEIEAALAEHDQVLSFEPPTFDGRASIGGTVACNLSGPARPWRGGIRDMILGVRLINGVGEHLRFGGQVLKNVAGYDVSRCQAGALGTLGVLTELTLRVMPRPAASLTLSQDMGAMSAIREMNRMASTAYPLTGACWLRNKLYIRVSATRSAVDGVLATWAGDVLDDEHRFWQSLREMQNPFFARAQALWRFSVRSTADHFLPDLDWLIDWAGSLRWLGFSSSSATIPRAELERAAEAANGQVMMFRGDDRYDEVFHTQAAAAKQIHVRLKKAFDPAGILNPGRLYSWL